MGDCVSRQQPKIPNNLQQYQTTSNLDFKPSKISPIPEGSNDYKYPLRIDQFSIDSVSESPSVSTAPKSSRISFSTTSESVNFDYSQNSQNSKQTDHSHNRSHSRSQSSNTLDIIEFDSNTLRIFNYCDPEPVGLEISANSLKDSKQIKFGKNNKNKNNKIEFGVAPKAKIVCFKEVNSDKNNEDISQRECKIYIEDNETKIIFLSCYDPICWILDGKYLNNIEKVIICETKHSNIIRECWYPDGSLPRIKGIEKLNKTCQIGLEMGYQTRYLSDFKACYYSQCITKQKRIKLINYIENEYKCKVTQIVQSETTQSEVTL